jgi:phosphohistidine phosphatase
MKVYLVQHGEPVSKDVDPDRPLSDKGRQDVEKVGALLKRIKVRVAVILQSGKTRALQTADILDGKLGAAKGVVEKAGLAPNDSVAPIRDELMEAQEDVMIVGHLPFLAKLATTLMGGTEEQSFVEFKQGGVVCLQEGEAGNWHLGWMIIPELLAMTVRDFDEAS